MCGIVGIVKSKNSSNNIMNDIIHGLEKLEYRGYDSAGIAIVNNNKIIRERAVGKLINLKNKLKNKSIEGIAGIGHTRWATHGKPTENNAHPIISKDVAIVHNGIIENYKELKFDLENEGFLFTSQTDTEVIAHLIQKNLNAGFSPRNAMQNTIKALEGSYAIVAIISSCPETLFIAKNKSSLVIGYGENMCVGSDYASLSQIAQKISYLENGDYAEISQSKIEIFNAKSEPVTRKIFEIEKNEILTEEQFYPHFMLKEIMEQPVAIRNTMLHNRIQDNLFKDIKNILILACGSSYYAGSVGKYWLEKFLKIPTSVEMASEFRYRDPVISDNTLVIAVSQSGETLDTLAAIEYVQNNSNTAKTSAIVNIKNSAIARSVDYPFFTEADIEMGVASTKTFSAQLALFANLIFSSNAFLAQELQNIPMLCEEILSDTKKYENIAENISTSSHVMYLGRGNLFPIALEGALKLKEISYIPAEGFAAGEMKHGPIALIDDNVPVIFLCPYGELFEKTSSNINEILARGNNIIILTDSKGAELLPKNTAKIILPKISSTFAPIIYAIPLQLIAYYTALKRGTDVDMPRNLAKSVTVE